MSAPAAPFKTSLGLEELQLRTRRLGQRHRTFLLLVDGRRPLGEILGMGQRAGADTRHFEELVRLGLVEVPQQAAAPEPRDSGPVPLDVPTLTNVAFDIVESPREPTDNADTAVRIERVIRAADDLPRSKRRKATPVEWLEPVALREIAAPPVEATPDITHDDGPDTVANPEVDPMPADAPPVSPSDEALASQPVPVQVPEPVPPKTRKTPVWRGVGTAALEAAEQRPATLPEGPQAGAPEELPAQPLDLLAVAPTEASPPASMPAAPPAARPPTPAPTAASTSASAPSRRARRTRAKGAPDTLAVIAPPPPPAPPRPSADHEARRHEVRSLLMGSMGAESALFSPLTLSRLRQAHTPRDFIAVVWEIERQRNHVNRSRAQLFSLERARELLGMGNTVVAGDEPADTGWPDTQGG